MRLAIVTVANRGNMMMERIHLRVAMDADASYYVIFSTVELAPQTVMTIPNHAYWFPHKILRPGDNVVVYTRGGVNNSVVRPDGGTDHFFFWGRPATVWTNPAACAVLMELNAWNTFKVTG